MSQECCFNYYAFEYALKSSVVMPPIWLYMFFFLALFMYKYTHKYSGSLYITYIIIHRVCVCVCVYNAVSCSATFCNTSLPYEFVWKSSRGWYRCSIFCSLCRKHVGSFWPLVSVWSRLIYPLEKCSIFKISHGHYHRIPRFL